MFSSITFSDRSRLRGSSFSLNVLGRSSTRQVTLPATGPVIRSTPTPWARETNRSRRNSPRPSVHATDTDDRWHLTIGPEGIEASRGDGPADLTLAGLAGDLYLAVWNRGDDAAIEVVGDRDLLDAWHANHRIRWS